MTNKAIGEIVGHAASTVGYVVAPLGGVFRRGMFDVRPVGRLSLDDRVEIYVGIHEGVTFTVIAVRIGMDVSTVSREVGGVAGRDGYRPVQAHERGDRAGVTSQGVQVGVEPGVAGRGRGRVEQVVVTGTDLEQDPRSSSRR
jgi:hypothetical protein